MKTNFIKTVIFILVLIPMTGVAQNSNPVLKIAVYTTPKARADLGTSFNVFSTVNTQIENAQMILDNAITGNTTEIKAAGIADLGLDLEEKHLGLKTMAGAYNLAYNYAKNGEYLLYNSTSSVRGLSYNDISFPYLSLEYGVNPDITIFVVSDDYDGADFYLSQNFLSDINGTYEYTMPALIKASRFKTNQFSISLAIFGLLADYNNSAAVTGSNNGSLLSYFSYFFEFGGQTWNPLTLSNYNKCTTKNNLTKLELQSLGETEVSNSVKRQKIQARFNGNSSVLMVPDAATIGNSAYNGSKILYPEGTGSFITMEANAYPADVTYNTSTCTVANRAIASLAGENESFATKQPDQVISSPLTLYPNPFTNSFKVVYDRAETASGVVVARVYDLSGRVALVQQFTVGNATGISLEIDGCSLSVGHYIIELIDGSGIPKRGKLIKEQ